MWQNFVEIQFNANEYGPAIAFDGWRVTADHDFEEWRVTDSGVARNGQEWRVTEHKWRVTK